MPRVWLDGSIASLRVQCVKGASTDRLVDPMVLPLSAHDSHDGHPMRSGLELGDSEVHMADYWEAQSNGNGKSV
jgi:hypothetical protein